MVEHWCEVVVWLSEQYADDYHSADLRTRLAMYHAMGLIADASTGLDEQVRDAMPAVDWKELVKMRVILVHVPWKVDPGVVWESATEDIPLLVSELRRHQTQQAG